MKKLILASLSVLCYSCSPFSPLAKGIQFGNDDDYPTVYQPEIGLKTQTFGDFDFATNTKRFKAH